MQRHLHRPSKRREGLLGSFQIRPYNVREGLEVLVLEDPEWEVLHFDHTAGAEVGEGLGVELGPVREGAVEGAAVDELASASSTKNWQLLGTQPGWIADWGGEGECQGECEMEGMEGCLLTRSMPMTVASNVQTMFR